MLLKDIKEETKRTSYRNYGSPHLKKVKELGRIFGMHYMCEK